MIKFSKLADYAVVILGALSQKGEGLAKANAISVMTGLPEPTVSKVLKLLSAAEIVISVRGAKGGYALNGGANDISVARIVEAIDGPVALTSCADDDASGCHYAGGCLMYGRWTKVNRAVKTALDNVFLSDMVPTKHAKAVKAAENQAEPTGEMKELA